jgi:phosphoribosylformimino-5-aminoimidazole carboxamide ribotide isomerase
VNIYPAIDLNKGRCVRLQQGEAARETVFYEDPSEPAALWNDQGAEWVHVVDLEGAFNGTPRNQEAIERILASGLKIQVGGGIREASTIREYFRIGVSRVIIGTRACEDPEFICELVGDFGEQIVIGIDAKDGMVRTKGWVEDSNITVPDLVSTMNNIGVSTIIYTDISTDGMLIGPNLAAQEEMLKLTSANVIASGGVSSYEDVANLAKLAAKYPNLDGVIIGMALYEGRVTLSDLTRDFGR